VVSQLREKPSFRRGCELTPASKPSGREETAGNLIHPSVQDEGMGNSTGRVSVAILSQREWSVSPPPAKSRHWTLELIKDIL